MKISYKNTRQDFIDFSINNYYKSQKSSTNSEESPSSKFMSLLFKILMLVFILLGLSISYDKSNKFLIYFSLLILIIYIIYLLCIIINPNIFKDGRFKDKMLKILAKKANKNIKEDSLSTTTLTLSKEGISLENDAILFKTIWSNIENAVITENHIFIYIKYSRDFNLFIIPLKAFNETSQKEAFLEIIKQHNVNIVNSIDLIN